MGIYLKQNPFNGKWYWEGFMCQSKEFDTKEEAEAYKSRMWKHHVKHLNAWNIAANMLLAYR